jgi:uncharacterized tellurite resistance protein B-like protein
VSPVLCSLSLLSSVIAAPGTCHSRHEKKIKKLLTGYTTLWQAAENNLISTDADDNRKES